MTPQKQEQTDPMFHYFQMEDLVPEDHILRQIDEAVDFHLYETLHQIVIALTMADPVLILN